ncbi:MAG: DUF349 domain-containing protein [Rhodanobacteraceae bacterium]
MPLHRYLFKPRWESGDRNVRRSAVEKDDALELRELLPQIARSDPDAGVRIAAMRRLAEPGLTQILARDDADGDVRSAAQALWLELLAGVHPAAPPLDERLRLLHGQDTPELIDHIARQAPESAMRGAALARVERTSVLAERALGDPDPDLRVAALERITDEGLLERIAERARRTDKQINRRARARLDALRIARNDDSTLNARARELCEHLEHLVRAPALRSDESEIEREWQSIIDRVPAGIVKRYAAACTLLAASRNPIMAAPATSPNATPDASPPADHEMRAPTSENAEELECSQPTSAEDEGTGDTTLKAFAARARFDASIAAAETAVAREREQQQLLLEHFERALLAFERALDNGKAKQAHAAHAHMIDLRKQCRRNLTRSALRRLNAAEERYGQISRWQRWGDNQRRRKLCEEMHALPRAGLHPDAVATRVREARVEWNRLHQMEGASTGQASRGMARRFAMLCRQALEPAKPYFKKRQAVRQTRVQEIVELLAQIDTLRDDSDDWRGMRKLRQGAAAALTNLDQVDPRERKQLASDIKQALDRLNARLNTHYAAVENAKTVLIEEARALAGRDARATANSARALQKRWQATGNGRRHRDQTQWRSFRAALDAAFAQIDIERAESAARAAAARDAELVQAAATAKEAAEICVALEACASGSESSQRSQIAMLESRWKTLDVRDEALGRRYRDAQAALREARAQRARNVRRASFDNWMERYRLCREAERDASTADLHARWERIADSVAGEVLSARFEAAFTQDQRSGDTADDDIDVARDLLVQLETLAGIDTPVEDRQRRRDQQLARLSAHLRGDDRASPAQRLGQLLEAFSVVRLPDDAATLHARLERALRAALDSLP